MNLLIWDFDGTLGYRDGGWTGTLLEVLEENTNLRITQHESIRHWLSKGFPWHSPDEIRAAGNPSEIWWHNLKSVFIDAYVKGCDINNLQACKLADMVKEAYLNPNKWHLYEYSKTALKQIKKKKWKQIILSNHIPELEIIVTSLGIDRYFDAIISSANSGVEKPNPLAFKLALKRYKHVDKIFMIGDNYHSDIQPAEALGFKAILVRNYHPDAPIFINDLSELDSYF